MPEAIAPQSIGLIMLAAGASRRFSGDKRRALLQDGRSLLETTLAQAAPGFSKRLLMLAPGDEELASQFQTQWRIGIAQRASEGMGHSLAAAMAEIRGWQGALVCLADMPYIKPETYAAIRQALGEHAIVAPVHGAVQGNPVGFRSEYFPELAKLQGDRGAKSLLRRHRAACHWLPCEDDGILRDVDTPDMQYSG